MRDVILEVVQITSADSWFVGSELDDREALIPVAFFALVKSFNIDYPDLGMRAHIIPVPGSEIEETLVGRNLSDFSTDIVHVSKFRDDDEA